MHPRTQILQALLQRLAQAAPELGGRMYLQRALPLARTQLPALLVYALAERIDERQADPGPRRRELELALDLVGAGEQASLQLDELAAKLELALERDETLGGLIEGLRLQQQMWQQDADGEVATLQLRLQLELTYWTHWLQAQPSQPPQLVLWSVAPYVGAAHEPLYQPVRPNVEMGGV
ncbi:MAG: hypothetical protein N2690_01310 [Rhodocyclaceae bacterium]|nr:hypothetical protein [Rhodocyclaceae bacterium]